MITIKENDVVGFKFHPVEQLVHLELKSGEEIQINVQTLRLIQSYLGHDDFKRGKKRMTFQHGECRTC